MINVNELTEIRPTVRYKDGSGVTLESVQKAIELCAEDFGIPVRFRKDQVVTGGFFNKDYEDCIVLSHPDHAEDYFQFCIRVAKQGNYAFVSAQQYGRSKQMRKADIADSYKSLRKGKPLAYKVGSVIGQAVTTAGRNRQKLEEEQRYYQCVLDIFDEIVS